MTLKGFENWKPYRQDISQFKVDRYEVFQGDLFRFSNTPDNCFEMAVSGCCDIYRINEKLDFLSYIKVMPLSIFLEKRLKDQKKKKLEKNQNQDGFSTLEDPRVITSEEFEKNLSDRGVRGNLVSLFKNEQIRYVFLPHQSELFEIDVVLDLQSLSSIELIEPENKNEGTINNWLPNDCQIIEVFARLDYRYRDFILQKLSNYMSRIALPEHDLLDHKKDENGFFSQIMARAKDEFDHRNSKIPLNFLLKHP